VVELRRRRRSEGLLVVVWIWGKWHDSDPNQWRRPRKNNGLCQLGLASEL
jgi:hypothetical protein